MLEEVPECTLFKGKQCPAPLLPYGPFCITELPESLLLLRPAAGMDLVSLISFFLILDYFFKLINLFWLCWVFIAARGNSLVAASRGYSSLRCAGSSLR